MLQFSSGRSLLWVWFLQPTVKHTGLHTLFAHTGVVSSSVQLTIFRRRSDGRREMSPECATHNGLGSRLSIPAASASTEGSTP